jgi:hypothetical protein
VVAPDVVVVPSVVVVVLSEVVVVGIGGCSVSTTLQPPLRMARPSLERFIPG